MGASNTTELQAYRHSSLQRVLDTDLNDISALAIAATEEVIYSTICERNVIVNGLNVTFKADNDFEIDQGVCLFGGRVLKETALPTKPFETLDDTGADPRIDVIYVAGISTLISGSDSRVAMTPIVRTDVAAEAVGTGDGSTKVFTLDQKGVVLNTLKVKLDATQVGGWNYSKETGGANDKDQIIFATAPGAGVEITADYTWQSGGVEGSTSVNTRSIYTPGYAVAKGTPAASPSAPLQGTDYPADAIPLAEIHLPASWTGGNSGVSIKQDFGGNGEPVRTYLVYRDKDADTSNYAPGKTPYAGRLWTALRGISQIVEGCRVQFSTTSQIKITPGWGVVAGVAFHVQTPITLNLTGANVPNSGWWYVYGVVDTTDNDKPGSTFSAIHLTTDPPDSLRREKDKTAGYIYLGAIYATAAGTIRKFYTHGNWVYWALPTGVATPPTTNTTVNMNVSAWCPSTGRLLNCRLTVTYTPQTNGNQYHMAAISHKVGTSDDWPKFVLDIEPGFSNQLAGEANGILRAEEDSGSRYVRLTRSSDPASAETTTFYVMGYLDDYRTMNESGSVSEF